MRLILKAISRLALVFLHLWHPERSHIELVVIILFIPVICIGARASLGPSNGAFGHSAHASSTNLLYFACLLNMCVPNVDRWRWNQKKHSAMRQECGVLSSTRTSARTFIVSTEKEMSITRSCLFPCQVPT